LPKIRKSTGGGQKTIGREQLLPNHAWSRAIYFADGTMLSTIFHRALIIPGKSQGKSSRPGIY
jgi:hypothetical protein